MTEEQFTGLTVFIPTYNRRRNLQRAVESALAETRVPIQVHVFDNASTDDTEAYVRAASAADPRLRYSRRAENVGARGNYERAFAEVEGAYLVPLADDDLVSPDFLHDAYQILELHPEACAAAFVAEVRDGDGRLKETYPEEPAKLPTGLLSARAHMTAWMQLGHYHWSAVLWRAEFLRRVPPPYLATGMPSDVDFQGQLFSRHPAYVVNRVGGVYTMHDAQISRGFDLSDLPNWEKLIRRLDAAVIETGLFGIEDYAPLRRTMLERYEGAWRKEAEPPLDRQALLACAVAAGFALGDWPFAFGLSGRAEAAQVEGAGGVGEVTLMPHPEGDLGASDPVAFEPQALTMLRWLKANHAVNGRLKGDLESVRLVNEIMGGRVDALMAERTALAQEKALLEQALEDARHGAELAQKAASELAELQSRRLELAALDLALMRHSASWRVTAPLRAVGRLARRLLKR